MESGKTDLGQIGAHIGAQLAIRDRRIASLQAHMDSITTGNDDNVGRYNYYNTVFEFSPCRYGTSGGVERALGFSYHYYDRIIKSDPSSVNTYGIVTEYDYRMFYIEHYVWWLVRSKLDGIANVWKANIAEDLIDIVTDGNDEPFDSNPLSTSLSALREGIADVGTEVRELPNGWSIHKENVYGYNNTTLWSVPDTADWTDIEDMEAGQGDTAMWGTEYPPKATDTTSLAAGLFAWMRHLVFQLTDAEYFALVKSWKRSIEYTMNTQWDVFTFRRLTYIDANGEKSYKTPDVNSGY